MVKMKLHLLLAEKRMTQKELSEITGISKNTIGAYAKDNCKHVVKEHMDIFCKFFNCKIEDIIEFVEE